MSNLMAYHPRSLIRKALKSLLEKGLQEKDVSMQVFINHMSAFLAENLPCMALTIEEEKVLDEGKRPNPDERELSYVVDILCHDLVALNDEIEALSFLVERLLTLDAIESSLHSIFIENGYTESDIFILETIYEGLKIGFIGDEARVIGCVTMNFTLKYKMPKREKLPDFNTFSFGLDMGGRLGENGQGLDGKTDIALNQCFETEV